MLHDLSASFRSLGVLLIKRRFIFKRFRNEAAAAVMQFPPPPPHTQLYEP
jgi:hypothetical protein